MVLVDKKILLGGISMVIVGLVLSGILYTTMPVGKPGMTEEETIDLLQRQQQNRDLNTLAGILVGVGFLLVLISFGARKKTSGGAKRVEKKPAS